MKTRSYTQSPVTGHRLLPLATFVMVLFAGAQFVARPAHGQVGAPGGTGQQRALVFEFVVDENVDPALGRKAADALATELSDTQRFDVIPHSTVEAEIARTRGLTLPLDKSSQLKVARLNTVEATTVFTGRVRRAFTQTDPPRGIVELEIYQMDVAAEELINGARVTGDTGPRDDITDLDQLIDLALFRATYEAVREMERTVLPSGTILMVDTFGEITLNIGLRHGVRQGQLYMVTRQVFNSSYTGPTARQYETHRVGTIRIISVEASQSTARVVWSTRGAQRSDQVKQIFSLGRAGRAPSLKGKRIAPRY